MNLRPSYSLIILDKKYVKIYYVLDDKLYEQKILIKGHKIHHLINKFMKDFNIKIVGSGLICDDFKNVGSLLWLKCDIVSFQSFKSDLINLDNIFNIICKIRDDNFNYDNSVKVNVKNGEIGVLDFLVSLDSYREFYDKKYIDSLVDISSEFKDKNIKMAFFNSTSQGGGVALMRHAMIRLYKLLGVDVKWYLFEGDKKYFDITKRKIHNVLQGIEDGETLLDDDINYLKKISKKNFDLFYDIISNLDIIVIDDPQPSFMIPMIKKKFPNIKIIYRSHIFIDTKLIDSGVENICDVWNILYKNISLSDLFVSHRVANFIPSNIDISKIVYMPPSTDLLDGLNKKNNSFHTKYYMNLFNNMLLKTGQSILNFNDDYIIQIARFDPAKGYDDLLESYKILCDKLTSLGQKIPQLVLVGNSAVDDPQGNEIYFKLLAKTRSDEFYNLKDKIKIVQIPYIDQMLNVLLSNCKFATQLSVREGFEVKVTESLLKNKPVIVYNEGGLRLQIIDGFNGFKVKVGDFKMVANKIMYLLDDNSMYKNCFESVNFENFTFRRCYDYLKLGLRLYDD